MMRSYDVAIIGGGINGAGIAADAAMRGLSVILLEKDDLASKTSSSSSKLIHGGLRYLEQRDFALVKKSLAERQLLLDRASHLVRPLPLMLPCNANSRSTWLLRAGLFLYDHLSASNLLPKTTTLSSKHHAAYFDPLQEKINKGFLFYDATADDARLVIANAQQASLHGAHICTETALLKAIPKKDAWNLIIKPANKPEATIHAKVLINAAGPWVKEIEQTMGIHSPTAISWIKGSHIVVKRLYPGDHGYLLQHADKRIVFVMPYHGFTMIGTTDVPYHDNLDALNIDETEIDYLLQLTTHYFKKNLKKQDIVHSWSGIRALIAEENTKAQSLSRDYLLHLAKNPAPFISVYGGKITTYRQLAIETIDKLQFVFPDLPSSNTHIKDLPGSNFNSKKDEYRKELHQQYPWLPPALLSRWLNAYGNRTSLLLSGCNAVSDLGTHFGQGLYAQEVNYLIQYEWARHTDDILWRRTKLGLFLSLEEKNTLLDFLTKRSCHELC